MSIPLTEQASALAGSAFITALSEAENGLVPVELGGTAASSPYDARGKLGAANLVGDPNTNFTAKEAVEEGHAVNLGQFSKIINTVASYAALRAYAGPLTSVYVSGSVPLVTVSPEGIAGWFSLDTTDTTTADDAALTIVDSQERRWKRLYSGPLMASWFGVTGDYVNCQAAMAAFETALLRIGGDAKLPRGKIDVGTWRPATWSDVTLPANGINIDGYGSHISYDNRSDVDAYGREPALWSVRGTSGTAYGTRVRLAGFTWDYTRQVNKGGASAATPGVTDVVPYQAGTVFFDYDFIYDVVLEDITGFECYGDGVRGLRAGGLKVKNVNGFNVSGGNPGSGDGIGGFVFFGLSYGCVAENCHAWNFRTYQTDTTGDVITSTAKNTPCGYIGFWSEYAVSNNAGSLPPLLDKWLSSVGNDTNLANHLDIRSLQNTFVDCLAYGYTMGFKGESYTMANFTRCTALNCWLPFVGAGNTGAFRDCYADMLSLANTAMPYAGYESVRAHYLAYNPSGVTSADAGGNGPIFDGCATHTNGGYAPFGSTQSFAKFLNQRSYLEANLTTGIVAPPFAFPGAAVVGNEISGGHVVVRGMTKDVLVNVLNAKGAKIDLGVYNDSTQYVYQLGLGLDALRARFDFKGPVALDYLGAVDAQIEAVWNIDSAIALANQVQLAFMYTTPVRPKLKAVFNVGSNVTKETLVLAQGSNADLDLTVNFTDAGSSRLLGIMESTSGGSQNTKVRCVVSGDNYGVTLANVTTVYGMTFNEMRTNSKTAAMINPAYGPLYGPFVMNGPFDVAKTFKAAPAGDPNSLPYLSHNTRFIRGQRLPYLLPVAGGKEGIVSLADGTTTPTAWAASSAVAVGDYRRTSTGVYQYTVAGNTASAAPTNTTGSTFADGTATAEYIGAYAQFAEYGSIGAALA